MVASSLGPSRSGEQQRRRVAGTKLALLYCLALGLEEVVKGVPRAAIMASAQGSVFRGGG